MRRLSGKGRIVIASDWIRMWACLVGKCCCTCSSLPLRPGEQAGRIPEGRRARCATFPDGTRMCLPEMPRLIANRLREAQTTGRQGGLLCLLDQPAAVVELSWPYKKVRRAKHGTLFVSTSHHCRKPLFHAVILLLQISRASGLKPRHTDPVPQHLGLSRRKLNHFLARIGRFQAHEMAPAFR